MELSNFIKLDEAYNTKLNCLSKYAKLEIEKEKLIIDNNLWKLIFIQLFNKKISNKSLNNFINRLLLWYNKYNINQINNYLNIVMGKNITFKICKTFYNKIIIVIYEIL
jgi:hypothetical protein